MIIPRSILGDVRIVAKSVPIAISACRGLLFMRFIKLLGMINFITAPITVAPKIALGSSDNTEVKGRTTKTKAPVIAPDQGDSAPANLFNELRPKEPPTGKAFESAAAKLATPWLTNSLFGFHADLWSLENVFAIEAGSANPIMAITIAGNISSHVEPQSKLNLNGTKPLFISPTTGPS